MIDGFKYNLGRVVEFKRIDDDGSCVSDFGTITRRFFQDYGSPDITTEKSYEIAFKHGNVNERDIVRDVTDLLYGGQSV